MVGNVDTAGNGADVVDLMLMPMLLLRLMRVMFY